MQIAALSCVIARTGVGGKTLVAESTQCSRCAAFCAQIFSGAAIIWRRRRGIRSICMSMTRRAPLLFTRLDPSFGLSSSLVG